MSIYAILFGRDSMFTSCIRMNSPKMGKRKLSAPTSLSPGPYSPPLAHTPPPGAPRLAACHVSTAPDFTLPERVQPVQARDPEGRVFSFSCPRKFTHQVGEINKDLYNSSSSPMSSEEEASSLPPAVHGRLWFSVLYDAVVGQLQVNLIKVKDLPGRPNSSQQTRDPFVKMFLLPDEKSSRTSKVKKKTISPIYNETHTFQVPQESMSTRVLRFSVYDVDRRRVRHSLGHVMLPLAGLDLTRGDVMWRDLDTLKHAAPSLGDLQVSLAHYPANDKVKVGFHRARGLQGMDDDTETNTYIRAQLHYGHKVIRTKRTSSRPTSTDHSVNESLAFTVAGRQLSQCSIVIRLMFTSPFSRQADEEYGRLVIGPYMYARGEELIHWQEMVANPKVVATRWHALNGRDQTTVSY